MRHSQSHRRKPDPRAIDVSCGRVHPCSSVADSVFLRGPRHGPSADLPLGVVGRTDPASRFRDGVGRGSVVSGSPQTWSRGSRTRPWLRGQSMWVSGISGIQSGRRLVATRRDFPATADSVVVLVHRLRLALGRRRRCGRWPRPRPTPSSRMWGGWTVGRGRRRGRSAVGSRTTTAVELLLGELGQAADGVPLLERGSGGRPGCCGRSGGCRRRGCGSGCRRWW